MLLVKNTPIDIFYREENIMNTGFYSEIYFTALRKHDTDCYITYVPHLDTEGNQIVLKRGFPDNTPNNGSSDTAKNYFKSSNATLVTNASTATISGEQLRGRQIFEGEDINGLEDEVSADRWTLAIEDDGTLTSYEPDVTVSELLDQGVKNALVGFYPLINDNEIIQRDSSKEPRQVIGQLPNKDLIILTCDGRTLANAGLTYDEICDVLLEEYSDIRFAYNLDGGGSAQTVLRGSMLNKPIDSEGTKARDVFDFLYIEKEEDIEPNYQRLLEIIADNRWLTMQLYSIADRHPEPAIWENVSETISDLNNITESGVYHLLSSTTGSPYNGVSSGFALHFTIDPDRDMHQQVAVPFVRSSSHKIMRRTKTEGAWSNWFED